MDIPLGAPLPVTVLTGFLGAGKTTLVNHLLAQPHGRRLAVVVNEFAALGVDDRLIVAGDETVIEMNNGCVCCTVRADLVRVIGGLADGGRPLDGVLVETTGLADPTPVAQSFLLDGALRDRTRLDAIVTVVDAHHAEVQLDRHREASRQIAFADLVLLNKTDLADDAALDRLEARVRRINGFAALHRTRSCAIDMGLLLDRRAFDPARALADDAHGHEIGHHDHVDAFAQVAFTAQRPVDRERFESWIAMVTRLHGDDLFRAKGVLDVVGSDRPLLFQGVHRLIDMTDGRPWPVGAPRESRLVFIGYDLNGDWLRWGFMDCLA
jgi:G3E family GTPase